MSRELPRNVPFDVQRSLISKFISQWGSPSIRLFHKVESTLERHFAEVAERRFSNFRPLHQAVR